MSASYFGRDYAPDRDRSWHLSILSSPSSQTWCVHDVRTRTCMALASALGDSLPEPTRVPERPASVSFIAMPELNTLVPEGVMDDGAETAHLELVHGALPSGRTRGTRLEAVGARFIYLHDEAAERAILQRHPSAVPIALGALLIGAALKEADRGTVLLVHRHGPRCDLVVARDGTLLLSNSFHAPEAADLLYFTLLALDRTATKPRDALVLTSGIALTDADGDLLDRYVDEARPAIACDHRSIAGLGIEAPERYLSVLEQIGCVS